MYYWFFRSCWCTEKWENGNEEEKLTCFFKAAEIGHQKCLVYMVVHGQKFSKSNGFGQTALMRAAHMNQNDCVKILLHCKYFIESLSYDPSDKIDQVDLWQCSALHYAASSGNPEGVEILLEAGANMSLTNLDSFTPLILSAKNGYVDCVNAFIKHDDSKSREQAFTALMEAAKHGKAHCIKALLVVINDINQIDDKGITPLGAAAQHGHIACIEELLSCQAKVDHSTKQGQTPLMLAAENGHSECIKKLAMHGANVNYMDGCKRTGLNHALLHGHTSCVKTLLILGAEVKNLRVSDWGSLNETVPLPEATAIGHEECVEFLLKHGSNPDIVGSNGMTSVMIAANCGQDHILKSLLFHKADCKQVTQRGYTALMFASEKGHASCLALLLAFGASANQISWEAVMVATENGKTDCLKQLLMVETDSNQDISLAFSSMEVAVRKGHSESLKLLLQKGETLPATSLLNLLAIIVITLVITVLYKMCHCKIVTVTHLPASSFIEECWTYLFLFSL